MTRVIDTSVPLEWWVLAIMFCLTELAAVRVRAGRATWTASLQEIPLVLGLFFVSPTDLLIARAVGSLSAHAIRRRGSIRENAFEVTLGILGTAMAVGLFRLIVLIGDALGALGWLAALIASCSAVIVVDGVGVMLTDRRSVDSTSLLWGTLYRVTGAAVSTGMALIGVAHLRTNIDDAWLVVVPVVFLWAGLRASAGRQERQQVFELLFEQGALGLGLIDGDLRLTRVNPAAGRLFGTKERDLVGRSFLDLIHEDDRAAVGEALANVIAGRTARGSGGRSPEGG